MVWAARSRDRVAGTCRRWAGHTGQWRRWGVLSGCMAAAVGRRDGFDLVGPAHGTMATHGLTIRCDRSDTTAPAGGAGKAPAGRRRGGVARVGVRSGATMLPR